MSDTQSHSPLTGLSSQPVQLPIGGPSAPVGFSAPAWIQAQHSQQVQSCMAIASEVLRDPLLLRQVSDRVYQLMLEDLREQHERTGDYGGRYGRR